MAMAAANTRKRILLILRLLYEKSDEENQLTTGEIMAYLKKNGLAADRKTLREDITFLTDEMKYDIITVKGSPNRYFWGERIFEMPELKLLIDAVESAHFISDKKSKIMIEKLAALGAAGQRKQLIKDIGYTGKVKYDTDGLYYIIDMIESAIDEKKKIQFQYYEYNEKKEKILRNNGEIYTISPYTLCRNEDNFYMVGYSDKRQTVVSFRVDRLYHPEMTGEKAVKKPDDFDIADYGKKIFGMFSGQERTVELECNNELMKYIMDRFGMNVCVREKTTNTFSVKVRVELSPTFYAWVFQFGGGIRILRPKDAVEGYEKLKKA